MIRKSLFFPVFWTFYFLRDVYRFIRDFSEVIADPWKLTFEIFFLCLGLFVVIGHWSMYLTEKKKKPENEPSKE